MNVYNERKCLAKIKKLTSGIKLLYIVTLNNVKLTATSLPNKHFN